MRFRHLTLTVLTALLLVAPAAAQPAPADAASDDIFDNRAAFAPLHLPTPNQYRAANGEPGPQYWQQRADYDIDVALDPATHTVTGSETITYTNNSPHALSYLWVQLDQNLFDPDSRGARLQGGDSRWRGAFDEGGYAIERVAIVRGGAEMDATFTIDDTRMRVDLAEALAAEGGQLQLQIDYRFVIPEYGADRMGRLDVERGTVYEFAQWYPRMYVFDDVNGWNPMPYLGQGEFYLEFGTFDVAITVPRDFIVAATGTLQNPGEVLTPEQQRRLEEARKSTEPIAIVAQDELGRADARPSGAGTLTWRFHADSVRDFAWAASQRFIWDAVGYEDVLVQAFYPPEGLGAGDVAGWEHAAEYGRHSIEHYSGMWLDYPYPTATSVGGIVGGMEYPMIQFSSVRARDQGLFFVIDHELGHNWFPMIVASDERRHAWMDEGFNTFINFYSNDDFYGEDAQRNRRMTGDYAVQGMLAPERTDPIATYPDRIERRDLGFLAYRKPGFGLRLLREHVLGPERFDDAFRAYIDRWAYKHPQPADFFRTIEDVSGEDLAWFWRGWFYSTGTFDAAIASVTSEENGSAVTVANEGELVLPLVLEVTYAGGSTERVEIPVEAFFKADEATVTLNGRVASVRLDPAGLLPDVDRADDTWRADVPSSE